MITYLFTDTRLTRGVVMRANIRAMLDVLGTIIGVAVAFTVFTFLFGYMADKSVAPLRDEPVALMRVLLSAATMICGVVAFVCWGLAALVVDACRPRRRYYTDELYAEIGALIDRGVTLPFVYSHVHRPH